MNIRTASALALIATLALTILYGFRFVNQLLAAIGGLVAVMTVVAPLIELCAALALTLFFYSFYRSQV